MDELKKIIKDITSEDNGYEDYSEQRTEINKLRTRNEFEQYLVTSEVLEEFGFEGDIDIYLGKNYFKHNLGTPSFRNKCLIYENFKQLDYAFSHPFAFNYKEKTIYALASLYKKLSTEQQDVPTLFTFLQIASEDKKRRYGYSNEEAEEIYPLTEEKLQMMERIHKAKINAKNKSGGGIFITLYVKCSFFLKKN